MINLSNYEEYFLLYIDNELSKEQCEAVEAFMLQHPHLAAELNILQEAKLPPADAIVFSDKNFLYKTSDTGININNYEEYFLLHSDKELPTDQEGEVEQFVLQHPQLQEEFLLLQQTKLVPEYIAYPDKKRLYKQPGKRVIPLYIMRTAVAAVITGVVVLIGSFWVKNSQLSQVAMHTSPNQIKSVEKSTSPGNETAITLPEKKSTEVVALARAEAKSVKKSTTKESTINNQKPALPDDNKRSEELLTVQINSLPGTPPPVPAQEEVIADNNVSTKQSQPVALKPLEEVDDKESVSTVMYVSNEYTSAKPAIYKELNIDEDDETLYVGSLQLNKAKVNGLLKKATHLLGSKTKESNL